MKVFLRTLRRGELVSLQPYLLIYSGVGTTGVVGVIGVVVVSGGLVGGFCLRLTPNNRTISSSSTCFSLMSRAPEIKSSRKVLLLVDNAVLEHHYD